MNGIPINQKLPAGLMDKGVEFYYWEREIWCLYGGRTIPFDEIPEHILDMVESDMVRYPEAIKALTAWDIIDRMEMLRQYILCRFGGFDNEPDIDANGNIEYTEYFDCGKRGKCNMEGKLCPQIAVATGYLTKQEVKVVRLTGLGKSNSEIAGELDISEETVKTHMQNIQQKCGFASKLEISAFAVRKNLV